jgi:hypothetical protein
MSDDVNDFDCHEDDDDPDTEENRSLSFYSVSLAWFLCHFFSLK